MAIEPMDGSRDGRDGPGGSGGRDEVDAMLCRAQELAGQSERFYQQAVDGCPHALGRSVFLVLRDEEKIHAERLAVIRDRVAGGAPMEEACLSPPEGRDFKGLIQILSSQYGPPDAACRSGLDALNLALAVERDAIEFFEEWRDKAQGKRERAFLDRVVEEKRGRFMLLSDAQFYFEKPGSEGAAPTAS